MRLSGILSCIACHCEPALNNACHCEPVRRLVWPLPGIPSGHNPFPKAFPSGEGGSRVSRKRETDEGLHAF